MKKIMQILPSLDHSGGGVEKGALDVAREISVRGYRSLIVSSGGDMSEKYKHKGVIHINPPRHPRAPRPLAPRCAHARPHAAH